MLKELAKFMTVNRKSQKEKIMYHDFINYKWMSECKKIFESYKKTHGDNKSIADVIYLLDNIDDIDENDYEF